MAKQRSGATTTTRASGAWTEEEARAVLEAWKESGQSGAEFARSVGVVPQRLFWWRRRLPTEGEVARAKGTTLVPVVVRETGAPARQAALVVTMPEGMRIEVDEVNAATAAWVSAVVRGEGRP